MKKHLNNKSVCYKNTAIHASSRSIPPQGVTSLTASFPVKACMQQLPLKNSIPPINRGPTCQQLTHQTSIGSLIDPPVSSAMDHQRATNTSGPQSGPRTICGACYNTGQLASLYKWYLLIACSLIQTFNLIVYSLHIPKPFCSTRASKTSI